MKKITLAIALLFLVIIMAEAKQISPETALETAKNFFSVNYPKTRSHTTNLKLIYTGKMSENNVTRSDNSIENYYYVFGNENDAPGFVMIAADDRIQPILGYSFDNRFITENMPQNIRFWLDAYNKSIAQIITSGNYKRTERELKSTSVVGPLLGETQWNQLDPYYNDCPTIRDTHCLPPDASPPPWPRSCIIINGPLPEKDRINMYRKQKNLIYRPLSKEPDTIGKI